MDKIKLAMFDAEARELAFNAVMILRGWLLDAGINYWDLNCIWSSRVDESVIGSKDQTDAFLRLVREGVTTLSDSENFQIGSEILRRIFGGSVGRSFARDHFERIVAGSLISESDVLKLGRAVWPEVFADN